MATFNEHVVEYNQPLLKETVDRIRERAQPHFTNLLKVELYVPEEYFPGDHDRFIIWEVRKSRWLGFIPRKKHLRSLFAINLGFYGGAYHKKEVNCGVFDRSLLDIVKEEVQKYADAFQATAINLTKDFAS